MARHSTYNCRPAQQNTTAFGVLLLTPDNPSVGDQPQDIGPRLVPVSCS